MLNIPVFLFFYPAFSTHTALKGFTFFGRKVLILGVGSLRQVIVRGGVCLLLGSFPALGTVCGKTFASVYGHIQTGILP